MIIKLIEHKKNLNSRPLADSIFDHLLPVPDEIIIDFKDIESASPSFCHEMLLILKKIGKPIKIINADQSILSQINKAYSSVK